MARKETNTRQQALEIRILRQKGWSLKEISKKYDISESKVSKICRFEIYVN